MNSISLLLYCVSYVIKECINGCCMKLFISLTDHVMSGSGVRVRMSIYCFKYSSNCSEKRGQDYLDPPVQFARQSISVFRRIATKTCEKVQQLEVTKFLLWLVKKVIFDRFL